MTVAFTSDVGLRVSAKFPQSTEDDLEKSMTEVAKEFTREANLIKKALGASLDINSAKRKIEPIVSNTVHWKITIGENMDV
ncbi:hypothetical protein BGX28_000645, partial [Mortierella sp. GBA30]